MIFNVGAGGNNAVYLTQAEYDALPDSKLSNGVEYRITDANVGESIASNLAYDNTYSGIQAVNVQTAIDEVNDSLNKTISADNYIEIENNWVATESGIVVATTNGADNSYLSIRRNNVGMIVSTGNEGGYGLVANCPVVKGDIATYVIYGTTINYFRFYPYVSK